MHFLEKMLTSSGWHAGSREEDSVALFDLCTPEEPASLYSWWVYLALADMDFSIFSSVSESVYFL